MLVKKDVYRRIENARKKRFSKCDEDAINYYNGYMKLLDEVEKFLNESGEMTLGAFKQFLDNHTPSFPCTPYLRGIIDASNRVVRDRAI